MPLQLAIAMLAHHKLRLVVTVLGLGVAFFLTAAQTGLLVGWCNTTSAIIRHADADIWIMAEQTPAFDYGTSIPRHRIQQARSVPGVAWAHGLFMGWNYWQRPDGRRVNIELVGLDDDGVAGPWRMRDGDTQVVELPDHVIVDELFLSALGVSRPGDEVEILGQRAIVGGVSQGVRTFTAAPFIFTSLDRALRYDGRTRPDEVTYVLVRCHDPTQVAKVQQRLAATMPAVEVLTRSGFAWRTIRYWMLETGVGITVLVTAALALVVGAVVVSQTLYSLTQDHLPEYAALLAIGFSRAILDRLDLHARDIPDRLAGQNWGTHCQ